LFVHPATTYSNRLPLHDALPIFFCKTSRISSIGTKQQIAVVIFELRVSISFLRRNSVINIITAIGNCTRRNALPVVVNGMIQRRSEEHTSELQSRENLVCRLLLE